LHGMILQSIRLPVAQVEHAASQEKEILRMVINSHLFEAYLKCHTRCWLRSQGEPGESNSYAIWLQSQNEAYRSAGVRRLIESIPPNEYGADLPATGGLKAATWRLAVTFLAQAQCLESGLHAVERLPSEGRGKPAQFIPIRFVFTNKLGENDKLLLEFDALVLSEVLGREVAFGKIIHGDDHALLKVKTSGLMGKARSHVERTRTLLSNSSRPDLVLKRHCAECESQMRCRQKAMEKDDLSLLANMTEKERKKYHGKGIFTVTQLSYTFRPRRHPTRMRDKRERYHHSLKALAIREQTTYIVGYPELKIEGTPVYLDVEGLPDCDSYYLVGVRIGHGESAVQHSLWADSDKDEGELWRKLLAILDTVETPALIHYGNYETTFLKRVCERYGGPPEGSVAAKAIHATMNLLSVIYAQIYFPTFSNGLKEIAGHLGFRWSEYSVSGVQTIAWRYEWAISKTLSAKQSLLTYNSQNVYENLYTTRGLSRRSI
jgi:predicted RecB family nuclease